jgi:hypothetical protein
MKFFRFDIGDKARKASRLIGSVRAEFVKALIHERENGLTRQAVATKLQIPRSELNDQLTGTSCLTLRDISDLAWALDRDIKFELTPRSQKPGQNLISQATTIMAMTPTVVGTIHSNSTLPSRPQTFVVQQHQTK